MHYWAAAFAKLAPETRQRRILSILSILESRRESSWTEWAPAMPGELEAYSPDTSCPQPESIDAKGKQLACRRPATHVKYIVRGSGMFLQAISCERHTTELPSSPSS